MRGLYHAIEREGSDSPGGNAEPGAGLFLTGMTASAQYRPRQDYGYQDEYGNYDSQIVRRVMRDLDRAENTATPASGDRWRLDDLNRLRELRDRIGY